MSVAASVPRHNLESYLPRALRERLASAEALVAPEVRVTAAAALLTDIQGFTALVESFAARGKPGLEELTWRLNAYVADVVGIVESYGGDVLSIAGDAFLCHWPAVSREDLPIATTRAAQAALAIQQAMEAAGDRGFPTRIGIGAGELLVAHVGGVGGRWELVASGSALADAAAGERQATAGQVLMSESSWRLVADVCEARAARGGTELVRVLHPPPSTASPLRAQDRAVALDDKSLRAFIPPAVLARLVTPDAEWLAESRPVTVMLAAIPGLANAQPSELRRVHACVHTVQEIVERYEGTVRVDIDDKGLLLLAGFGLPPRAHEDDAVRALLAAADLQRSLSALHAGVGVGVSTGRALCGAFGSDVRRDYIVRGDVINLAARLMHADPGAVLCDAPTVQAARGRIAFEPLEPIRVRGRAEPVAVFRPTGRAASVARAETDVIGRRRELAVITERLAVARTGEHAGVTIVQADAGLGKSKLAGAAARRARDAGLRVFTAVADAIEQSTAYYAWRPVLSALFDLTPDDDATAVRGKVLQRTVGLAEVERLLPLLSGVLAIQIPDTPLTAEMTGDVRADNTKRLLRQILQRFAEASPMLLVVEDAHWLDSASWGLLLDVVNGVRPLMVFVATRPLGDSVSNDFTALSHAAGDRLLQLDALSPEETRRLVAERLGVGEVPPPLATFVEERVAGHPFFCEELLRALLDAGVVSVRDGICTIGDLTAVDLPSTVEGVIISRLDRLTAGQQLCLKVASVIGRIFRERIVRETHPVDGERGAVHGYLEALSGVDLTALEAPEPDLAYLFKHVITRDVTYESMPFAQRQPMHRAVATWYEQNFSADLAPYFALLAYHWARAANPSKTVDYLEKAGEQALHAGAFREALLFLAQAVELVERGEISVAPTRRALWEKGLGRAQYYLGALHTSRLHNERALVALHRPVPSTTAGAAIGALAGVARQVGHRLFPGRYLGRRVSEKSLLDEAVECYKILGQAYYLEAEPPLKLLYLTITGLNIGEEAGSSAALARVVINSSMLAYLIGLPKQAEWYGHRAIEMGEREGLAASAYVWHIHALALAQRARWADAKAANEKAQDFTRELGDFGLEAEGWTTRTTMAICQGDFAFAPTGWKRQRELAERNGNAQLRCWSLLDETDTWLGRGDTEAAARSLEAALAIPTPSTDLGTALDKARSTAMTRLRQGRDEEAARAADQVFDPLVRQAPTGYQWADDFCEAVEVYLDLLEGQGEYARAHRVDLERRVATGCKLAKRFSRIYRNVAARAFVLRGRVQAHHGKLDAARGSLARAESLAAALDMPFEQGRARLALARVVDPAERSRVVAATVPIFERLGADYYRDKLLGSDA